jgi:RNA polymerase sporulation-specific sigma factor
MPHTDRRLPRPTTGSERRLILAARRGDATAQARVLSQYEPMMRLIARRLYLPGGEPDDLAQEARIGLVDAVHTWDPARGVPFSNFAWLCATREARTAINAARANKHQLLTTAASLEQAEAPAGEMAMATDLQAAYEARTPRRSPVRMSVVDRPNRGDDDPLAKTLAREQLRALIARTRTLSPLERRALMLANNDRPHTEIAATLHIRVRAVNNALQRARHKLRELEPSAA